MRNLIFEWRSTCDSLFLRQREPIVELAARHAIPAGGFIRRRAKSGRRSAATRFQIIVRCLLRAPKAGSVIAARARALRPLKKMSQ
jgi:hypothetical protein